MEAVIPRIPAGSCNAQFKRKGKHQMKDQRKSVNTLDQEPPVSQGETRRLFTVVNET